MEVENELELVKQDLASAQCELKELRETFNKYVRYAASFGAAPPEGYDCTTFEAEIESLRREFVMAHLAAKHKHAELEVLRAKLAETERLLHNARHEWALFEGKEYVEAYISGYETAAKEIQEGTANFETAKDRGLDMGQDLRIEWDQGYEAAVCAYILGYDPADFVRMGLYGPSTSTMLGVVQEITSGRLTCRPDPRRK